MSAFGRRPQFTALYGPLKRPDIVRRVLHRPHATTTPDGAPRQGQRHKVLPQLISPAPVRSHSHHVNAGKLHLETFQERFDGR